MRTAGAKPKVLSPVRGAPAEACELSFIHYALQTTKGRFRRPFGFGQGPLVFVMRRLIVTLPLEDLAATYSPAS